MRKNGLNSKTLPIFGLLKTDFTLNVFTCAYNLIINRMTRSENMMKNNNQINLKFW